MISPSTPSGCPFHHATPGSDTPGATSRPDDAPEPGSVPAAVHEAVPSHETVISSTRTWVEKAVVGLNLCPFANAVLKKRRLHIQVSDATEAPALLEDLRTELARLLAAPETEIETSLLVCPRMLDDFLDFNDFLDLADALLSELDLHGMVQIASFHPHYQFAGTATSDIENATNQSPWPTLHLLRETSIDRAVTAWGDDTDHIYENNIARLKALGPEGWQQLSRQWQEHEQTPGQESPDEKPSSVG